MQRRKGVRTVFWGVGLGEDAELGRPKRADEAAGMDHSLNRGKARSTMFHKPEDDDAFEWHFGLQPTEDRGMSNFLR
jgi:hypothetical protein